jgi:hypothetical protein
LRLAKADAIGLIDAKASKEQIQRSVSDIEKRYDGLGAKVRQKLQPQTIKAHDLLDKNIHARERMYNDDKVAKAKEEKRLCEDARRRLPKMTYDWSEYKWKPWVEVGFFGAETCYNAFALSMLGGSLIMSILPAIALALSLCVLSIYIGTTYMKLEGDERKKFVRNSVTYMSIAFIALSMLRSMAAIGRGQWGFSWSVVMGALAYVAVNWLIFAGAVIFGTTLPSKEDRMLKHEHDELDTKIASAKAVIEMHEKANREMDLGMDSKQKGCIDVLGDEVHFAVLIRSYCDETVALFHRELTIRNPQWEYSMSLSETAFNNSKNSLT